MSSTIFRIASICLFFFSSFNSFGQLIPDPATGKYQMEGVLYLSGTEKSQIFNNTLEWLVLNYHNLNVIQYADPASGKILVKGSFQTNQGWVEHTLIFDVKEEKMRYRYSNFAQYSGTNRTYFEEGFPMKNTILKNTGNQINSSLDSIRNYIAAPPKNW